MIYNIAEIARITRGELSQKSDTCEIGHLLTDSRNLTYPEESLFFALKTKTNDGHKYIPELYECGVRNFVVFEKDSSWENYEANFVVVDDTLEALQRLVASHRRKFKAPVIGITGSNGKTVVKEWLYQLLQDRFIITRSPKSFNSQIGVPLSVWQMNERTELGIFEAGISQPGEMQLLEKIIRPRIGIFTNLGEAHNEGFVDNEEKLAEKLLLFQDCKVLVYAKKYAIEAAFRKINKTAQLFSWAFNDATANVNITSVDKSFGRTTVRYIFEGKEETCQMPFTDDASLENALHCLALCLLIDVREDFLKLEPVAMRLEVKQGKNGCQIINDSYNSDMGSLVIALDFLNAQAEHTGLRKTLILSDIAQTGFADAELYTHLASLMQQKNVGRFIGIGEHIRKFWHQFPFESRFFATTADFLASDIKFENEVILVKGARSFAFEDIVSGLELKRHETVLEVNLNAITHNFKTLKSFLKPETKTVAMIKANAYGCGAVEVAQLLQHHHCDYFGVAVADEGAELRKAGIRTPIIVMDPEPSSFDVLTAYHLEPEIYNFRMLRLFSDFADRQGERDYPIHLKIDTGMHRLGFMPDECPAVVKELEHTPSVRVESVFSHLATADCTDMDEFTKQQIANFSFATDYLRQNLGYPFLRHILNTAGVQRFPEYQYEMVRLGIGLYGIGIDEKSDIRPIATLRSVVLQIKDVAEGEAVGYSRKGLLHRPSRIAAIPIGYADGLHRAFGNGNSYVLIRGKKAPFIGNICMDICMVDVTDIPEACEGDSVEIFGAKHTINDLADVMGTIPYEILTGVSNRVKRVYYQE
ncbi:MAG: bifunctional UDP-N-acetylmuramoyl-tripeptide:D-alanyl-D-alanine ligase/alanine racemase [Paludibacteraceae bacterium]|nr:bifunctional UDP-N-acetylmuramoyl-tripeptide:D-alanyl-D-alanine ligase/alanine racemase [Paludibacteraceae bacterium]